MLKPYELENYVTISANYQKTEIKSFIFMYDFFVTLILIAYQHTIKRIFIFFSRTLSSYSYVKIRAHCFWQMVFKFFYILNRKSGLQLEPENVHDINVYNLS